MVRELMHDIIISYEKRNQQKEASMKTRLWKNDKMYAFEETDEGFQVIKRYSVSWQ